MEQLSSGITSFAENTNSEFPFVTDQNFEVTGGYADGMGGIMAAAFAPFVTSEQRPAWEAYSVDNQAWIKRSKLLKVTHPFHRDGMHGTIQDHEHDRRLGATEQDNRELEGVMDPIVEMIYRWDGNQKAVEPVDVANQTYAPLWQMSPAEVSAVNFNLLSDPRIYKLYEKVMDTRWSVMSSPLDISDMLVRSVMCTVYCEHYHACPLRLGVSRPSFVLLLGRLLV